MHGKLIEPFFMIFKSGSIYPWGRQIEIMKYGSAAKQPPYKETGGGLGYMLAYI